MSDNTNLARAHANKNDEYYTRYVDVEKEIPLYAPYLKGKAVYCNCDDPDRSNIYKYLQDHFFDLELSSLTATYYDERNPVYKTVYDGTQTVKTQLMGNGSFDSAESVELLKASDVLITNPPFSKYVNFFQTVINSGTDFLIVTTLNVCVNKDVFPYIKEDKLRTGYHQLGWFMGPDNEMHKVANTVWLTSLPVAPKPFLPLTEKFDPEKYPVYDDFSECIEVSKLRDIPEDYDGLMGVPITFLQKQNPEQFEIVGNLKHGTDSPYDFGEAYINGVQKFSRIVIRRV